MEKALNLWVEDMNQKCVLVDGEVLRQKALRPQQGISETSDTKPFTK